MRIDFVEFLLFTREMIASGKIKVTKELSDYDLAILYAIGEIGKRKGYPCDTTVEEIYAEINVFAPELNEPKKEATNGSRFNPTF